MFRCSSTPLLYYSYFCRSLKRAQQLARIDSSTPAAIYAQSQLSEFAGLEFVVISEFLGEHWHVTNACHLAGTIVRIQPAPENKVCSTTIDPTEC